MVARNEKTRAASQNYGGQSDLRWIVTALAPGIAAKNPPTALATAADRTVLFHRLNEIRAARRRVFAAGSQPRADVDLVKPGYPDQDCPGKFPDF